MERMAGLLIVQVLIVIGGLSLAAPTCREGFHLIDKGFCCRPIKCPKDYQYHLCDEDNGSDTCTPCKEGTINPDVIDTSKFPYPLDDLCFQPECTCAPEAKLMNPYDCRKTGRAVCVCNIENFFYGNDGLNCFKANLTIQRSASRAGFQLTQQGNVAECPPGYFKSENDSSTCRPHTRCPKGSSVDVPGTRIHDTRCKIDNETESTSPIPPDQSPTSTPADPDISALDVAVYIAVVIIIICVIILLICCCVKPQWYNKLKCYARKENSPSTNAENEELMERNGDGNVTDKHGEEEVVDGHGGEEAMDRHGEDEAMDRHGEEEEVDRHGEEEEVDRHGEDGAMDRHGEEEAMDRHGEDEAMDRHGEEEMVDRHGEDGAMDRHGEDEAMDRHGEDEAVDRHGEDEAMDRHGEDEVMDRHGEDGAMDRHGEEEAMDRHGEEEEVDRHGEDEAVDRHGEDEAMDRHGEDGAMDRHGEEEEVDRHGEEEAMDRHGEEEAVDRHGEDGEVDRHGEEEAVDRHGEDREVDRQSPAMLLPTELTSSDSGGKFSDLPGSVGRTMDFDSLSGKDSGVASLQHNIPQEIVKDISEPKFKTDLAASEAPVENRSDTKDLPEVVGESLNFSSVLSEKDSQADDSEADSDMTNRVSTMTSSDPRGNDVVSFISEVSVDQGLGDSRKSGKKPTQIVRPVQFDSKEVSGNNDQDETESKEYF